MAITSTATIPILCTALCCPVTLASLYPAAPQLSRAGAKPPVEHFCFREGLEAEDAQISRQVERRRNTPLPPEFYWSWRKRLRICSGTTTPFEILHFKPNLREILMPTRLQYYSNENMLGDTLPKAIGSQFKPQNNMKFPSLRKWWNGISN